VAAEAPTGETTSKAVTEAPEDGVYRGSTGDLAVAWTVEPYFVVSGRTALTAEVTGASDMFRLEVVAGDTVITGMCPVTKMVDVSGIQPGIREVSLRVTDKTGLVAATPAVPLVFAGAGAVLPLAEGIEAGRWAGWGQRSDDGQHLEGKVPHVKAHAQVPAGTKRLLVLVFWDEPEGRRIGVDIGTGDCPHQGVRVGGAGGEGAKTMVPVLYEDPEGKDLAEGTWFVHVRVKDAAEHAKPFTFHYQFIAIP
jgi:hypothetical protein